MMSFCMIIDILSCFLETCAAPVRDQFFRLSLYPLHSVVQHRRNVAGLDYLTEFQKFDRSAEPRFVCDLCGSKMDANQVINHVIGYRHRMKYFVRLAL